MSSVAQRGTMALEDGAGLDFAALRRARRDRVFDAMDEHDLDVLMLGRGGNARYVTGHRPIWRSVVTPWAPMCTVVRATGQLHLLATTSDDGIPADVPHENLMPLMWNPRKIFGSIGAIPGLADAGRLGVDGMSTGMSAGIGMLAPKATLVDGERVMRDVRAIKTPAEVECIRTAIAITEGALAAVREELRPGIREIDLKARFHEALCRYGVNHPAMEGSFCATPRDAAAGVRLIPDDRAISAGDLVAVSASAPYAGYEGVVARTWPCLGPSGSPTDAQVALHTRWRRAHDAVLDACRPGAPVTDLERAWTDAGELLSPVPIATGIGLGVEQPVVGVAGGLPAGDPPASGASLQAGMVLGVQGYVADDGLGGYLGGETLLVTDGGPVTLTRLSHDPLSGR